MIDFTATTHPGNRYQHNEDAIGWSEEAGIWFVADGIGGHARGDLASAIVKKTLLAAPTEPQIPLKQLVLLAHEAVLLEAIEQSLTNMGSTLVLARINGNRLNIAWCGDSRAYLWRRGKLNRLTRDHSLLEQLLESGVVTPEEAFGHPRRNVLVQALGINEPPPRPSEISLTLDNGDVLLLCSDGVHDELHDSHICDVLTAKSASATSSQAIVDELERRVLATDARDNLSVICLCFSGLSQKKAKPAQDKLAQDKLAQDRADTNSAPTVQRSAVSTRRRTVESQIESQIERQKLTSESAQSFEDLNVNHASTKFFWLALAGFGLLLGFVLLLF